MMTWWATSNLGQVVSETLSKEVILEVKFYKCKKAILKKSTEEIFFIRVYSAVSETRNGLLCYKLL